MHAPQSKAAFANRSFAEWLVSLPTFFILLTVIFLGTGEYIHSQLLKLGESQWDQYFILRADIANPTCNPDPNIDAEVERLVQEAEMSDEDELDMFAEEVDPEAIRRSVEGSRDLCREKWSIAKQNQERVTPGVRAFRTVETGVAKLVTFVGQYKQMLLCVLILICAAWATLCRAHISLRPVVTRADYYTATSMQLVAHLMLMFSEIAYRNAEIVSMADGVQVQLFYLHAWWIAGFGLLAAISLWQLFNPPEGLEPGGKKGHAFLAVPLYGYMAISASLQFWVIPFIEHLSMGEVRSQPYYQGIGVYLSQMMELSGMFLSLALYIWIGMLLKQTRLTELSFNLLRPWHLSPELMCFAVLVLAAWPTAYTGASGIFIIAAGSVIYQELMRAGARRQLAVAGTAMSGSMGVVLAPCLLVVIIAALNKDVTTGEMYHNGLMIYILTAVLFLIFSQLSRTEPVRIAPVREALPKVVRAFGPLSPYITILMAVLMVYGDVFNKGLDEFSAPYILPVLLLGFIFYDKSGAWVIKLSAAIVVAIVGANAWQLLGGATPEAGTVDPVSSVVKWVMAVGVALFSLRYARQWERHDEESHSPAKERRRPVEIALREATNETTGHIGALLMLMALSVSIGGTIERSHVMDLFPQVASIWGTMTILVVTMVIIGMIMDPYGAVILVNATIAQVAFQAGIDPLHFWMFALLSFELGYLTPPVALNQLLTRHIIGEKEVALAAADGSRHGGFWYRHEQILLPVTVMFVALIIIAYGPLAWQQYGWAEVVPDWVNALLKYTPD